MSYIVPQTIIKQKYQFTVAQGTSKTLEKNSIILIIMVINIVIIMVIIMDIIIVIIMAIIIVIIMVSHYDYHYVRMSQFFTLDTIDVLCLVYFTC